MFKVRAAIENEDIWWNILSQNKHSILSCKEKENVVPIASKINILKRVLNSRQHIIASKLNGDRNDHGPTTNAGLCVGVSYSQ
jgi:hypothetical protein